MEISEPIIETDGYIVKIIFYKPTIKQNSETQWPEKWPEKWPENASKILELMKKNPYISNTKLEEMLGIGHTTIKKIIKELQSMSIISHI